ncbi:MAG TPA: hypothetical protein VFP34_16175 [Microlunatus sp.]|nr:hypothetical protein [Microlunatus sp.]
MLEHSYAFLLELGSHGGRAADLGYHLLDPPEKARVVEGAVPDVNAERPQLACFASQTRGVGQDPNRHRTIRGGHAPDGVPGDQGRVRTQPGSPERSEDTCRPATDHGHIERSHRSSISG